MQNKKYFISKVLFLIIMSFAVMVLTACGKVTEIKDLYSSSSSKSVSVEGTVVDYNQRYIFISDGTGILNVKNNKN